MRYDHMDIPPVAPQVTRIELHDVSCWVEPARGGWTYRVEGLISQSVRVVARSSAEVVTSWLAGF
jgi:hypothetical protein